MIPDSFLKPLRPHLTLEEERQKRAIYDQLKPSRRKFIDRLGYDEWDPFQKPNDPMDMRTDATHRTTQQLIREFFHSLNDKEVSNDFRRGALNAALGIVNKEEQTLGAYAFFQWYDALLKQERLVS